MRSNLLSAVAALAVIAAAPDALADMAAAEKWCLARGVWKMNLMVRDDNTVALGFYDTLGYTHGGTTQLGKWIDPTRAPKQS